MGKTKRIKTNEEAIKEWYPNNENSNLNVAIQTNLENAVKLLERCNIKVSFRNLIQHFCDTIILIEGGGYTLRYSLNIYEFCKKNKIYVSEKMYNSLNHSNHI